MDDHLRGALVEITRDQLLDRLTSIQRLCDYLQDNVARLDVNIEGLAVDLIAAREHVAFMRITAETLA